MNIAKAGFFSSDRTLESITETFGSCRKGFCTWNIGGRIV